MRAMRFAAGVHTSTGLGAGGPIRPATINPGPDEPVYVTSVTNYIMTFLRKNAAFRGLPVFLLLMIAVSTSCIVRSSSEVLRRSNAALRDNVLHAEAFAEVRSDQEFMQFTETLLRNAYASRNATADTRFGGQRAVAVGALVVRQWRTDQFVSDDANKLFRAAYLPSAGRYNASEVYGTESTFWYSTPQQGNLVSDPIVDVTNASNIYPPNAYRNERDVFAGTSIAFGGRVYPAVEPQYQLGPMVYTVMSEADAIAEVQRALNAMWIDFQTKVLIIDTLWFSPTSGFFFYATHALEVLGSGAIMADTRCYPFRIFPVSDSGHPAFTDAVVSCAADVVMVVALLGFCVNFVSRMKLEIAMTSPGRSKLARLLHFWAVYDVILIALVLTTVGFHVYLFLLAATTLDDVAPTSEYSDHQRGVKSMSMLVQMAARTELADTLKGWLFITTWLRTFGFLQFIPRLAVVTETVKAAANDLVGVAIVSLTFIASFSLIGAVLFSNNIEAYSSTTKAFDELFQLVGTGEINDVDVFNRANPLASTYFILYLFVIIAVLLNAVIGILASSFVYSVDSYNLVRLSDWRPVALVHSMRNFVRRMRHDSESVARDTALIRVLLALEAALVAAHGYAVKRRVTATKAPSAESVGAGPEEVVPTTATAFEDNDPDDIVITLRQLRRLASPALTDDALTEELFRKAQEQRGTANGKLRYLRVFGRQRLREAQMAADVGAQVGLLQQVQSQLFGGAAKLTDGEEDEGGDDALLGDKVGLATQGNEGDRERVTTESLAGRPMYGFRKVLEEMAGREATVSRRVAADRSVATQRLERVSQAETRAAAALRQFHKNQVEQQTANALQMATAGTRRP